MNRRMGFHGQAKRQRGMVLLVSLVMLLLLTMIGISSMQNATLQEKMATSVQSRNQSFQMAEAALRIGETAVSQTSYTLAKCASVAACAPPPDSGTVVAGGTGTNGVLWIVTSTGAGYGVQNIGTTTLSVNAPSGCYATYSGVTTYSSATLYRITAVGIYGTGRSVVESIYAKC